MMENLDNKTLHSMHHPSEWGHSHTQLVVQQQVIPTHQCPITDDIRFSIITAISRKPGIWDSQREKTAGSSRKELFAEVTRDINQQHRVDPPLQSEEVEKQWKNLKDTYIKTRKKLTCNTDGAIIAPKWKFYSTLTFLENLFRPVKRRYDEEDCSMSMSSSVGMGGAGGAPCGAKRVVREDELQEEDDEYMGFCRSLVYPMREIGFKDRIQYLKLQKSIRDLIHETQMDMLMGQIR